MSAISRRSEVQVRVAKFPYVFLGGGRGAASMDLAYATWGSPNDLGDNAILLPNYYTGTHADYAKLIGYGKALNPDKYFIITTNLFGNGVSSSPSHWADADDFPRLTMEDNVRAQHALLASIGVKELALIAGWSLGAMQALHWAMLYPDMVRNVVAVCGTAFCWPVNRAFLASLAPILEAVPRLDESVALDLFGRVYAGWAYSGEFFAHEMYGALSFSGIQELLDDWGRSHQEHRAIDLLSVLRLWAKTVAGREAARAALGQIKARCLILPCDTDEYFTVADATFEAASIRGSEVRVLHSPFGHCAGAPGRFCAESGQIERAIGDVLGCH